MKHINSSAKWFIKGRHATDESVRIFTFPYAGGGASLYRQWGESLPAFAGTHAVQLPGRENRITESPLSDMGSLVRAVSEALVPHLDLPFILFGHSIGARIAFEVARDLRRKWGLTPMHLIVSGSRAPHIPEPKPLHHLPDDAFIKELERFSGTPRAVLENKELMAMLLPLLRADFSVDETYAFTEEPPLECPITAFGGKDDPEAKWEELVAWARHTSDTFNLEMLDGDHFFLQTERTLLLKHISGIITRVSEWA